MKKQRPIRGRPPGPPTERVTVYLPRMIAKAIREEASLRDLTLSALVLEAFETRARLVVKNEELP